jgi:hypothetical protein
MKRLITFAATTTLVAFVVVGGIGVSAAKQLSSCSVHPLFSAEQHARSMFSGSNAISESEWEAQGALMVCQDSVVAKRELRAFDRRLHT